MEELDTDELKSKMGKAIDSLKKKFLGLRTGRATVSLLDTVTVEAYDTVMPINQLGTVSVAEPRMLTVQVWDASLLKLIEKAIRKSDLGLSPFIDGQIIKIPVPNLSEDRRKELVKISSKYAEEARTAIRSIRRDGINDTRKLEKDGNISEDESRKIFTKIQMITDGYIKQINDLSSSKEEDIMSF